MVLSGLMCPQIFIRLVNTQIILQALALQLIEVDFQGPGVGQGEPDPFLAGRGRWRGRLGMKFRRYRHGRFWEGQIWPMTGATAT